MKKTVTKKSSGGLLGMISPAASLVKSLKAGEPVGLMKMTGVGQMMKGSSAEKKRAAAAGKPAAGMKSGGKVKGKK